MGQEANPEPVNGEDDVFLPSSISANDHNNHAAEDNSSKEIPDSRIQFYPNWCHFLGGLRRKEMNSESSRMERWANAFKCPPSTNLSRALCFYVGSALLWVFVWRLDPSLAHDVMTPLITLVVLGLTFGYFLRLVGLPDLLAPLVIGIVLNSIPGLGFFTGLHARGWITPIRELSLTIILTQAGVGLNSKELKKITGIVPLAAFGPCIVEALSCAALLYAFYYSDGIHWAMCFVAGFALGAVSPAVLVPALLSLQKEKYGAKNGIITLLIAASSIDDILAISAYVIFLGFIPKTEERPKPMWQTYAGILGIVVGALHGLIVGLILHYIPTPNDVSHKRLPYLRLAVLLLLNCCCVLLYSQENLAWLSGTGSLGVLVTSFVAASGWRSVPGGKAQIRKISNTLELIWNLVVPLLFGTIGKEITIYEFDWNVGILAAIIGICLLIRCLTMFAIVSCMDCTMKERLFCVISWIPKATVQAALAPMVVSTFENEPAGGKMQKHANYVVLLAVVGILLTAPSGAILMSLTGKKLLDKDGSDGSPEVGGKFKHSARMEDPKDNNEFRESRRQSRCKIIISQH